MHPTGIDSSNSGRCLTNVMHIPLASQLHRRSMLGHAATFVVCHAHPTGIDSCITDDTMHPCLALGAALHDAHVSEPRIVPRGPLTEPQPGLATVRTRRAAKRCGIRARPHRVIAPVPRSREVRSSISSSHSRSAVHVSRHSCANDVSSMPPTSVVRRL